MINYENQKMKMFSRSSNGDMLQIFMSMCRDYSLINKILNETEGKLTEGSFVDKVKIQVKLSGRIISDSEIYHEYKNHSLKLRVNRKSMVEIMNEVLKRTVDSIKDKGLEVGVDGNIEINVYCIVKKPSEILLIKNV